MREAGAENPALRNWVEAEEAEEGKTLPQASCIPRVEEAVEVAGRCPAS